MSRRSGADRRALYPAALAFAAVGCNAVLGLSDFEDAPQGSSEATGTSTTSTGGGEGGAGPTSTGTGGNGGAGGAGGATLCGNGTIDEGEACDGDCPEECFDPDLCTLDVYNGTPATCDVTCTFEPKVTCVPGDGCCPTGCHPGNDKDCGQTVLIVARDMGGLPNVKATLDATGAFTMVDTHDTGTGSPPLATLMPYDAVLVYTNANFADPVAIGDVLADYFDGGGRVVLAPGANCNVFGIAGRFVTDNYLVLSQGFANPNGDTMTVVEPNSPLMVDVATLDVETHCDGDVVNGGKLVASLGTSGDPLVVRGTVNGRGRVDLNFFPLSNSWTGDGAALLRNALLYP